MVINGDVLEANGGFEEEEEEEVNVVVIVDGEDDDVAIWGRGAYDVDNNEEEDMEKVVTF